MMYVHTHTHVHTHAHVHIITRAAGHTYHLYGTDVLLLLHVDVGQVEPDVRHVGSGLPHLGKHISGLPEEPFVCQH